jgi:hypothetical protein
MRRLKAAKIRFSFDDPNEETDVHDAIELCRKNGRKDIGVYCLIGYNDTPESARYRLDLIRSWGLWPYAMRYQPPDTLFKNSFIARAWTDPELRKIVQYYNRLRWNEFIPYEEFQRGGAYIDDPQVELFSEEGPHET